MAGSDPLAILSSLARSARAGFRDELVHRDAGVRGRRKLGVLGSGECSSYPFKVPGSVAVHRELHFFTPHMSVQS